MKIEVALQVGDGPDAHVQPMESLVNAYTKMWNCAFTRTPVSSVTDTSGTGRTFGVYSEYSQYCNYYNWANWSNCCCNSG